MSNAEFYYNLYVELYKDYENPRTLLIDRVWEHMKMTHLSSINERNPRLLTLDLIKKFCIYFPKIKYEYYINLDDSSFKLLCQLFKNNAHIIISMLPVKTTLQRIQQTDFLLYLFEICSVISYVGSCGVFVDIDNHLYPSTFLKNNIECFIDIIKKINNLKKEHKKKSYDEINIKLLQKKYPSMAQPLQYIVSKYL
jgi:hypothetical protein